MLRSSWRGSLVLGVFLSCAMVSAADSKSKSKSAASAQALYLKGMEAGNSGDLRQAAALMTQALAADPKHFMAQFDLGGAHEQLGEKDQALDCYLKATQLNPNFAEAFGQAGTLYLLHKNDYDKALATYKQALLIRNPYIDPRFPLSHTRGQVLRNLAIAYAQQKRFGATVGVIKSLLNDPAASKENLAVVERIGRMASLDLDPALVSVERSALDELRKQLHGGQPAEALKRYEEFAKTHPLEGLSPIDRWDVLEGIGMGHILTGKYAEAVTDFTKAAAVAEGLRYGQWQESLWNLACARAQTGKPVEAVAALEQVLFMDLLTQHDPGRGLKRPYRAKIATDSDLKGLQNHPALRALLATYPE